MGGSEEELPAKEPTDPFNMIGVYLDRLHHGVLSISMKMTPIFTSFASSVHPTATLPNGSPSYVMSLRAVYLLCLVADVMKSLYLPYPMDLGQHCIDLVKLCGAAQAEPLSPPSLCPDPSNLSWAVGRSCSYNRR